MNILEQYLVYLNEANKLETMLQTGKVAMKGISKEKKAVLRSMMRPQSKMTSGKLKGLVNTAKAKGYKVRYHSAADILGPHTNAYTRELILPTKWTGHAGDTLSRREGRRLKLAVAPHERQEIIDTERIRNAIKKSGGEDPVGISPKYGIGHLSANAPAVDAKETSKMSNQYGKNLQSDVIRQVRDVENIATNAPSNEEYLAMTRKQLKNKFNEMLEKYKKSSKEDQRKLTPIMNKIAERVRLIDNERERNIARNALYRTRER